MYASQPTESSLHLAGDDRYQRVSTTWDFTNTLRERSRRKKYDYRSASAFTRSHKRLAGGVGVGESGAVNQKSGEPVAHASLWPEQPPPHDCGGASATRENPATNVFLAETNAGGKNFDIGQGDVRCGDAGAVSRAASYKQWKSRHKGTKRQIDVARTVQHARLRLKMSQRDLAMAINKPQTLIKNVEMRRQTADAEVLLQLQQVLGVKLRCDDC